MTRTVLIALLFNVIISITVTKAAFLLEPKNVLGIVGSSVRIQCKFTGAGLSWQHIKINSFLSFGIDTTDTTQRRYIDTSNGNYDLIIQTIQQDDAGLYACQENQNSRKASHLSVISPTPTATASYASPLQTGTVVTTTCAANYVAQNMVLHIEATEGTNTQSATSTTTDTSTLTPFSVTLQQTAAPPSVPEVVCKFSFVAKAGEITDPDIDASSTTTHEETRAVIPFTTTTSTTTTTTTTRPPGAPPPKDDGTTDAPDDGGWNDLYLIPIFLVPALLIIGCVGYRCCGAYGTASYRRRKDNRAVIEVIESHYPVAMRYYPTAHDHGNGHFISRFKWNTPAEDFEKYNNRVYENHVGPDRHYIK